ncbi:Hypothetical predicted protein [Mytilus galloprovincialis]|uniref:Uncharacterized protein n=1 Tax=Mytilus galloprovincialis TaxID=29158 RepID=A0A8B6HDA1_MYTGA|nr:Hypothetical predicted protein [Mytilus galloprovincialis]
MDQSVSSSSQVETVSCVEYFGPFSEKLGISIEILNKFKYVVKEVPIGFICELRSFCHSEDQCISHLFALTGNKSCNYNESSVRRKIKDSVDKIKKMKKNKNKDVEGFLGSIFKFPERREDAIIGSFSDDRQALAKKIVDKTKEVVIENRVLKRKLENKSDDLDEVIDDYNVLKESYESLVINCNTIISECNSETVQFNNNNEKLKSTLNKLEEKYKIQSEKLDTKIQQLAEAKSKLGTYGIKNVNKKLKRKNEKIKILTQDLKSKTDENEQLWEELGEKEGIILNEDVLREDSEKYKNEIDDLWEHLFEKEAEKHTLSEQQQILNKQKVALQKRVSLLNKKFEKTVNEKKILKEQHDIEIENFEYEKKDLNEQIKGLEKVNAFLEGDTIATFENGKYTNEVRECCMQLVTEGNVSLNKLPIVITSVLKNLTGKLPERLPSKSLISSRLMVEAKIVACKQACEAMLTNYKPTEAKGNVLHQDATTKYHDHYEGMQVTLKDGSNLSLGLSKVGGGDAATYTKCFNNIIDDLARSYSNPDEDSTKVKAKLITSIKCFLSDQCATNNVFNENIEKIRKDLLPTILSLIAETHTHSFESDESGTFRLARTAAKALTKRGSDKSGIGAFWEVFLKGRDIKNHLVTFHGHRINIAFHDCAAVYFHRNDILELLQDYPEPNGLLKSVLFDIKAKVFIAGARAMGMLDKLVTAPFWKILEQEGSILDINNHLLQMKLCLSQWAADGSEPFSGALMYDVSLLDKDDLYNELFKETNDPQLDSFTQIALELLCAQLQIILERQAASQLPGGSYWEPSKNIKEMSKNVPKTNAISERDMAILDNLLKAKPAAKSSTLETVLMWTRNKPSKWLCNLPVSERHAALESAQKLAPQYIEIIQNRQKEVETQIANKLAEKKAKQEKSEQTKMTNKLSVSREIIKFGGVWDKSQMEEKINKLEAKKLREALLVQIKFHKVVLLSKGSKELFQETYNKKKYSNEELQDNLTKILELNDLNDDEQDSVSSECAMSYKSEDQIQESLQSKKNILFSKLSGERLSRQIKQQKESLPYYVENPKDLVGKKISQKCSENNTIQWFDAQVISIKKLKADTVKTEYNIRYDDCPDDVWFFPLLMDLKKGDLLIKS